MTELMIRVIVPAFCSKKVPAPPVALTVPSQTEPLAARLLTISAVMVSDSFALAGAVVGVLRGPGASPRHLA